MRLKKEPDYKEIDINPTHLVELEKLVRDDKITGNTAKEVLLEIFKTDKSPEEIVEEQDLGVVSDEGVLEEVVKSVIADNPKAVDDYRQNPNAVMFLVGQVMGKMQGKADASKVKEMLINELET
jgi:aspartyl-tRNA(Asn)/glutamyl-tRNA(Gln) amidotransferase subunit B